MPGGLNFRNHAQEQVIKVHYSQQRPHCVIVITSGVQKYFELILRMTGH